MSFAPFRLRMGWRSKSQENASHFLPRIFLAWRSARPERSARESLSAWMAATGCDNVRRTLSAGAPLYLYWRCGAHLAPSNAEFDASLRAHGAARASAMSKTSRPAHARTSLESLRS